METCKDCATPITQPATGGRMVRCAPCGARRRKQQWRQRYAASPEIRAAGVQRVQAWRGALTPEQRTPEKIEAEKRREREYRLQRKYGIGVDEFDALLAAQDGRCAICGTDAPNGQGWQVDHDHESGAVRGILCFGCNVSIGHLNDNPALLRAAAAYIESCPQPAPNPT